MTVILIPATNADVPVLLNLLHTAYEEYRGKLAPPSGAHSETLETVGKKLQTAHVIKAVIDEMPVGCVFIERKPDSIYFSRLAVLPAYRGQGVGRQMVAYVEAYARAQHMPRVTLGVRLAIPANIEYYTKLGYSIASYACHAGYTEFTSANMEKVMNDE